MRFENRTGVDSVGAFGAMLADLLTNGLTRSGLLSVAPQATVAAALSVQRGVQANTGLRAVAVETNAGILIGGSYARRADSLVIQVEITDVGHDQIFATLAPVVASMADQVKALDLVVDRVQAALAARLDPRLAQAAPMSQLPMSLAAYREYAAGWERYFANDFRPALEHFYKASHLDSTSAAAALGVALTEWNANGDIGKTDSILRRIQPLTGTLQPLDLADYDYLRAWVDGDAEAALRASKRMSQLGLPGADAQDALRLNRLDEARTEAESALLLASMRQSPVMWGYLATILHAQGDHRRELAEVRRGIREIGPSNTSLIANEIRALAALGRIDEVQARFDALR